MKVHYDIMIKDTSKAEKEILESYREALKRFIIEEKATSNIEHSDTVNYIAMFSSYIYDSNPAYKYNYSFLPHQHEKFREFLIAARDKCNLLRKVISDIKDSPNVAKYLKENKKESSNIFISVNDFLISDLNKNINFHEKFSISGAERKNKDNVYTIQYERNGHIIVRASKIEMKNNKWNTINCTKLVKLVEKVIGIGSNVGGGSNG